VSAPKRQVHETGADTQVCPYRGCIYFSKTINAGSRGSIHQSRSDD